MTRKFRINTLVKHVDGMPFIGSDQIEATVSGYEPDGYVRLTGLVGCYNPNALELVDAKSPPRNPYEFYTIGAIIQALLEHEGAEGFSYGLRERAEQIAEVI
jgi:hypothetical protein